MAHPYLTSDLARLNRTVVVLAVLLAVVLVVVAVEPTRGFVDRIDRTWHGWMVAATWGPGVDLATAFAAIGSVWVTVPLRIVVAAWLAWRRKWARLSVWLSAIVVSEPAIGLLKAAYARPRPPLSLETTDTFAFPSGHAIAGAVTAVALVAVLTNPGQRRWHWWGVAVAFAGAMALSRTYLRVHWLTDVLAGTLLGATVGLAAVAAVAMLRPRVVRRLTGAAPSARTT